MSRNGNYTTGTWLDLSYHQKYNTRLGTKLSKQTNTSIAQQINFIGKLEGDGAAICFIAEKKQKKISTFCLDLLIVTR